LEKSQFKAFLEGLQQLSEFYCNFLPVKTKKDFQKRKQETMWGAG
jgi:hypothetical protein